MTNNKDISFRMGKYFLKVGIVYHFLTNIAACYIIPPQSCSLKFTEESSQLAVGTGRRKPMNPIIIQVRDVSEANHQPQKVFSTNIEINKSGHKIYYPSETHTKYRLVRKFGDCIGELMHFLLTFPDLDHVFIESYSIDVALKRNVKVSDWSPTIDKMVELCIETCACQQELHAITFLVERTISKEARWFTDPIQMYLSTFGQEFWRPFRPKSNKYLKVVGSPWTKVVPSILKVPGVEKIEFLGASFMVLIGEVFIPQWDTIEAQILNILADAFHQEVIFKQY